MRGKTGRERLKSNENIDSAAQRQVFDVLEKCSRHEGSGL